MQVWPLQHARLAAFFALVALAGAGAGLVVLKLIAPDAPQPRTEAAIAAAAAATSLMAFGGVLFHRLNVLREKFRETEAHLQALEVESGKYRALLEGAADMVLVLDPTSGAVLEVNGRAREELGLDGSATFSEQLSSTESVALRTALAEAVAEPGRVRSLPEVRVRSAKGRMLVCEARLAAVELANRCVVQVALRDRTHERAIENELAVRERLSSLGLLTAGVAHEINNPLEGIGNHVKLLERKDIDDEARTRHVEMVRHGFERIRDLVRDLLRFARPASEQGAVDLAAVVERAWRLAAYSEGFRGVEVTVHGLDGPRIVQGDAGRLEQVVFNLLLNASVAMKGHGRIAIRASHEDGDAPAVVLAVVDDGPGITPEHLEHIFDPFFTMGAGTGLGLSIVFGIVQAHGGTISAHNRPEGGAEFTLRFPDPKSHSAGEAA